MKPQKEGGYFSTPAQCVWAVVVVWGIVPWCAKSVNLPGGTTTMIVNWTAFVAVLLFMLLRRREELSKIWKQPRHVLLLAAIGLVWPLTYSISYFNVMKLGSASLAVLLNYTWPLFAAGVLYLTKKEKVPRSGLFAMLGSVIILGVALAFEGPMIIGLVPIALGIIAAATQGWFNIITDNEHKYSYVWLLTLVGAFVTAIGSTLYTVVVERPDFATVTLVHIWPLLVIGVLGNGFGFWAFVKGSQLSRTVEAKLSFWKVMMLVPVAQVILLPFVGLEQIGLTRVLALLAIVVNFYVFKKWQIVQSVKRQAVTQ